VAERHLRGGGGLAPLGGEVCGHRREEGHPRLEARHLVSARVRVRARARARVTVRVTVRVRVRVTVRAGVRARVGVS